MYLSVALDNFDTTWNKWVQSKLSSFHPNAAAGYNITPLEVAEVWSLKLRESHMVVYVHPCTSRHSGILPIRCLASFRTSCYRSGCTIGSVSEFEMKYEARTQCM